MVKLINSGCTYLNGWKKNLIKTLPIFKRERYCIHRLGNPLIVIIVIFKNPMSESIRCQLLLKIDSYNFPL